MQHPIRKPLIQVACSLPTLEEQASRLARNLGLSRQTGDETPDLILHLTEHRLELLCPGIADLSGPVFVEFVSGAAGYRRRRGGQEMLLRAVGCTAKRSPAVIDATGGLGRDAFVLASHGCRVRLSERHPVIAALLADGLSRALQHPQTREAAAGITLSVADSRQILAEIALRGQQVDVVYLDPMFPQRSKSAKVKKELQVLQLLAGGEEDGGELLAAALATGAGRVVVKRPKSAPALPGPGPSHSHAGATTRFDVYLLPCPTRNPGTRR